MDACCLVTLGYVEVSDDAETRLTEKGLALYRGHRALAEQDLHRPDRYLHHLAASILVAVADATDEPITPIDTIAGAAKGCSRSTRRRADYTLAQMALWKNGGSHARGVGSDYCPGLPARQLPLWIGNHRLANAARWLDIFSWTLPYSVRYDNDDRQRSRDHRCIIGRFAQQRPTSSMNLGPPNRASCRRCAICGMPEKSGLESRRNLATAG